MKILVVTSCTKSKLDHAARAEELYTGGQHRLLMRGVRAARDAGDEVDVRIVSARFGLVAGDRVIGPYERTFTGMPADRVRAEMLALDVPSAIGRAFHGGDGRGPRADLAIVCLGEAYAPALPRPWCWPTLTVRFVARPEPRRPEIQVRAGLAEAALFRQPAIALKGEMAARLLERRLWLDPTLMARLGTDPSPLL